MKKSLAWILIILVLMAGCLTGCGGGGESSAVTDAFGAEDAEYTWKVALNTSPGDLLYDTTVEFCKKLEELSDGNIATEIYAGGVLGRGIEVLEGLSFGMADVQVESIGTLANFTDYANIDAVPYIYSGYDHFIKVWQSSLGEEMREKIGEEGGFKLLGGMYRGARITTAKKEMQSISQFKGFKLRVPSIDVYIKTWERIGATPTPLSATEMYTAIQQGTVDGQENPIIECYNYAMYDVCPYFIKTNHVYSQDVFIMNRNRYEALPKEVQEMVTEAAQYASDYRNGKMIDTEAETEQKVIDKGVTIIDVDTQEFIDAFDGFVEGVFPYLSDWSDEIKAMDEGVQEQL